MAVLSVHESVPGHHLQIALQQELEQLPNFRRYSGFTVFIEGWGLYSERLGYDMGLYEDPYDRFGQLTYDMWRAVRLVVDTGMHYKGWSRQRAIDYFKSNAPKSELDIINEIDRYISMPGQALAYKIGQLKILALRAEAEQRLGEEFDIKAFHDIVLGSGAIPLDVLQTNVRDWLDQQTKDLKKGVRS
jgi:prolyl oligopeptidase